MIKVFNYDVTNLFNYYLFTFSYIMARISLFSMR